MFLSSADWMPRNLDRRIEVFFPVEYKDVKLQLKHILNIFFKDNVKARILKSDGSYKRKDKDGNQPFSSQDYFCNQNLERIEENSTAQDIIKIS